MKKVITLLLGMILFYACSSSSDSNGNTTITVSDIDGNTYEAIAIGNQTWTKKNLIVTKYRNGDVIPQVTDPAAWANLTTGAWCYFNNETANGTVYGKLYNWYAVIDPRGLAPTGYHIPTDSEWTTLTTFLGGENIAGGKMKETGTTFWNSPNTEATNSSNFSGLPGGSRENNGVFTIIRNNGNWWCATENSIDNAWCRNLGYNYSNCGSYAFNNKRNALSVRCVKD